MNGSENVPLLRGASLHPVPPGESKVKDTRTLDIHEDDPLDEAQLAALGEANQPIARGERI